MSSLRQRRDPIQTRRPPRTGPNGPYKCPECGMTIGAPLEMLSHLRAERRDGAKLTIDEAFFKAEALDVRKR